MAVLACVSRCGKSLFGKDHPAVASKTDTDGLGRYWRGERRLRMQYESIQHPLTFPLAEHLERRDSRSKVAAPEWESANEFQSKGLYRWSRDVRGGEMWKRGWSEK